MPTRYKGMLFSELSQGLIEEALRDLDWYLAIEIDPLTRIEIKCELNKYLKESKDRINNYDI